MVSEYNSIANKRDVLYSIGLFFFTVMSRIPFRSRILYHWDSVNFANAMGHFDMLQEHPQPPGYIVYVWLCRLVDLVFRDPNATMVWISVASSSFAVALLYLLGRTIWNQSMGLVAALFLASSPLFWFYGEIALPHTLDAFLVIFAVWLLYQVRQGKTRALWVAILILSLAGGVRQQTLVFLLPLTLYATWRAGWKLMFAGAFTGFMLCLIWFTPLITSCGGIEQYLDKTSNFTARFQKTTSILMGAGWSGVAYNLRKLGLYTTYGLGAALFSSILGAVNGLTRWHGPRCRNRFAFLGLWITPALLFYSLIHMGQQGLIFIFLPALLLSAAAALGHLAKRPTTLALSTTILVALNIVVFCLMPEYPFKSWGQRFLTKEALINSDNYYVDRFTAIRENLEPKGTMILSANWDHVRYYMPEYTIFPYDIKEKRINHINGNKQMIISDKQCTTTDKLIVVLFDPIIDYDIPSVSIYHISLKHGGELRYLIISQGTMDL